VNVGEQTTTKIEVEMTENICSFSIYSGKMIFSCLINIQCYFCIVLDRVAVLISYEQCLVSSIFNKIGWALFWDYYVSLQYSATLPGDY